MTKIYVAKLCLAGQVIAFLIPLVMLVSGHKATITGGLVGQCLAIAAFSKVTEGILTKKTNFKLFEFPKREGIGDYWLVIMFWVGLGFLGVYLALR